MPLPKNNLLFGFATKLTDEQRQYVNSIFDHQLTIVDAPAGTGKTTLAVACAKIIGMKLVYVFSPVEEQSLGYRPGTTAEKCADYLSPLHSALIEIDENPSMAIYNEDLANDPGRNREIMRLVKEDKIWVYPKSHTFVRGSNIKGRTVIIDEAQNYTQSELKKVLTRIHDDCKVIIIGHNGQCDLKNHCNSGFQAYIDLFSEKPYAKVCKLTKNFRGQLATDADSI